jgi:hypothetical protein
LEVGGGEEGREPNYSGQIETVDEEVLELMRKRVMLTISIRS